jgi:hypothetical protein
MRQNKKLGPGSDFIRTGKALGLIDWLAWIMLHVRRSRKPVAINHPRLRVRSPPAKRRNLIVGKADWV